MSSYVIGVDFGTASARAVLVDCHDGRELASRTSVYKNGVIDERLPEPDSDVRLEADWALQDPQDYLRALADAVPEVIRAGGIDPGEVIGVGIDATSCTMLPTTGDGTPLCMLEELRRHPHAWVKLWKHHAAQPEADLVNAVAAARGERWLGRYGGKISSEWFFPKALQILLEAPEVYERAERLIEVADWIVWQLTGQETRSACTAGYKAIWSKRDGFPAREYFAALDPRFTDVVDEKMSREIASLGACAGGLSESGAALLGLPVGVAVAVANVDAHVSVPAAGIVAPGQLLMVMGTSTCSIVLGEDAGEVEGMCGVVEDGVLPGLQAYEAGQSAVGDIFGWFVEQLAPPASHVQAAERGSDVHEVLADEAAALKAGESGLLALDWWNGNRSVLVDAELSGLVLGMTLATRPHHLYRALIEATAFGARTIVDAFERAGVPIDEVVACGGLPERNALLMQIYADVLGRRITVAASSQAPALGSALYAAVAAGKARGGYDRIEDAVAQMVPGPRAVYEPDPGEQCVYEKLYADYTTLHDLYGRTSDIMRRLREQARAASAVTPCDAGSRSPAV